MAEIAKKTGFTTISDRFGDSAYFVLEGKAGATTATTAVAAPYDGRLTAALFCNGATVGSASNNYIATVLNASESDRALITAFDSGTNTVAAYGTADLTLSSTAADLEVTRGDIIEIVLTVEGTVTGANVLLYFEAD